MEERWEGSVMSFKIWTPLYDMHLLSPDLEKKLPIIHSASDDSSPFGRQNLMVPQIIPFNQTLLFVPPSAYLDHLQIA